jgi:hypothetical protein
LDITGFLSLFTLYYRLLDGQNLIRGGLVAIVVGLEGAGDR